MKLLPTLICFFSLSLHAATINITYLDEAGVGFNSTESYTPTTENPAITLGEARRYVLERTVRMFSTQFNNDTPIFWGVKFGEIEGYGALTLGPSMREYSQGTPSDEFGILKYGLHYPNLLRDALLNRIDRTIPKSGEQTEYDARTTFTSYAKDYSFSGTDNGHRFSATVLHELVHLIGFASLDCLNGCIPQPISHPGHYNQFVYVEGDYDKAWNELTLSEKEDAGMLDNILYFKGSDSTLSFAANELFSGVTENGIGLHSGTNDDGSWDSQSVSHVSPEVTPAQLMYSAGADVNELGAAAYILCDIGWCRNDGFVADLSVTSTNEVSIKPNVDSTLSVEIANLSSDQVNNIFWEFEIPEGVDIDESSSTTGCKVLDKNVVCEIVELFPEQYIDIDIAIKAGEGQYVVDSKLYSKSFIVDPKGDNNLNILKVTSEESPFPTVTLDDSYRFTSGDVVFITPQYAENSDDRLTFSWAIKSGYELLFEQNANTGVLSFTAPEVTNSQLTTLVLTITSKGRTEEREVTISIASKPVEPEVTPKKSSGGGSIGMYLLLLVAIVRLKQNK
ncbi:hypothetical protein NBRC116592_17090 [Colwellia sp. KU-HH00111]|uniref:hypothetical protein n=1 Tax=Colwellia sp. KU-HH00111 TaxID=3127652 RepID=UPI003103923F